MDDSATAACLPTGTVEELSIEGQRLVEATVNDAHEVLATLEEVLTRAGGWAGSGPPAPSSTSALGSDSSGHGLEPLSGSVDAVRSRYMASSAALRAVITAITNSPQVSVPAHGCGHTDIGRSRQTPSLGIRTQLVQLRQGERDNGGEKADDGDLDQLEHRAHKLREVGVLDQVFGCGVLMHGE